MRNFKAYVRNMTALADQYGFYFDRWTGKTHMRWVHRKTGAVVFTSGTPRDPSAFQKVERAFRRYGVARKAASPTGRTPAP